MTDHIVEGREMTTEEFFARESEQALAKLRAKDDCEKYRSEHGVTYEYPDSGGFTTIPVLQFLWGLPLSNLILAYVRGLEPGTLRITRGTVTTDSQCRRVTIYVTAEDIVVRIEQAITCGYGTGEDVHLEMFKARAEADLPRLSHL